jgi:putative sugar O-methyltransferase
VSGELGKLPYPPDYQVSKRWATLVEYALRLANRLQDPRYIAYASMAMFDVEIKVLTAAAAEQVAERCRSIYHSAHPELKGIGDSPLARPGTTVMVDGVPYSGKTEQGFCFYHDIFTALPEHERTEVVVEIGSGFGRLARITRLAGRTKCFVLVDLPESLLFAYAFLKVTCPDARTHVIKSATDITPGMTGECDFIFCPVQLLAELHLDRVDLAINTYSFGEMTQGCVDHLMHCIHDVLRPRFLYSLNYIFCDKSIHFDSGGLDGEANDIILQLKPEWQLLRLELSTSVGHFGYGVHGGAVLRRTAAGSRRDATDAMIRTASSTTRGSAQWLGCMYLAALWADDPLMTEDFFTRLRQFFDESAIATRPEFDFDKIGEVKVLRRQVAELAPP